MSALLQHMDAGIRGIRLLALTHSVGMSASAPQVTPAVACCFWWKTPLRVGWAEISHEALKTW